MSSGSTDIVIPSRLTENRPVTSFGVAAGPWVGLGVGGTDGDADEDVGVSCGLADAAAEAVGIALASEAGVADGITAAGAAVPPQAATSKIAESGAIAHRGFFSTAVMPVTTLLTTLPSPPPGRVAPASARDVPAHDRDAIA
jgi:hypothetical protein